MGPIRNWIASHRASHCTPCDSSAIQQQSCGIQQPLIYSTPYASMGQCAPCQPCGGGGMDRGVCVIPPVTITDGPRPASAPAEAMKATTPGDSSKSSVPAAPKESSESDSKFDKRRRDDSGERGRDKSSDGPGRSPFRKRFDDSDDSLTFGRDRDFYDKSGDTKDKIERAKARTDSQEVRELRQELLMLRKKLDDMQPHGPRPGAERPNPSQQKAPGAAALHPWDPGWNAQHPADLRPRAPQVPQRTVDTSKEIRPFRPPVIDPDPPHDVRMRVAQRPGDVRNPDPQHDVLVRAGQGPVAFRNPDPQHDVRVRAGQGAGAVRPAGDTIYQPPSMTPKLVARPEDASPSSRYDERSSVAAAVARDRSPVPVGRASAPSDDTSWARITAPVHEAISDSRPYAMQAAAVRFDNYAKSEDLRQDGLMGVTGKSHPETHSSQVDWLLTQGRENLIKDFDFKQKMKDTPSQLWAANVVKNEDALVRERDDQWRQVRDNASNPNDPNMVTKQALVNNVMHGIYIDSGEKFGRMNDRRKEEHQAPITTDKLKWQVEAAQALVHANNTSGIDHDFTTRAIIRGLRGSNRPENKYFNPVPEEARVKLLDAIIPMAVDQKSPVMDGKPKDVALVTVMTALERSHASGRGEAAFQTAAIEKLGQLNDWRAIKILDRVAKESPIPAVKQAAAAKTAEFYRMARGY